MCCTCAIGIVIKWMLFFLKMKKNLAICTAYIYNGQVKDMYIGSCLPHNANYVTHGGKRKLKAMNHTIKRIWNTVTTVLVGLVVGLAVLVWGVQLLGLDVLVVQSGSMEPAYPTGSLVYLIKADAEELEVGDVVTFKLSANVRGTHRIIEVVEQEGRRFFRTKGDANEHADNGLLAPEDIVGQVLFGIPLLGYVIAYIQNPPGTYVAIAVGALLALLTFLPDLLTEDGKKKEAETNK